MKRGLILLPAMAVALSACVPATKPPAQMLQASDMGLTARPAPGRAIGSAEVVASQRIAIDVHQT